MRVLIALSFITLLAANANAQGLGYAEGGLAGVSAYFGHWSDSLHFGAGGDVVAHDHVGIGGEMGFFNRLLVGSANITAHLGGVARSKFSPFVTAGYSRLGITDGEGAFHAFNVGGGFHYWTGDRVGFRAEFRDHIRPDDRGTAQYWSARVGIAFR